MSSTTRITLALLIIVGSCLLLTGGVTNGLIVRANIQATLTASAMPVTPTIPPPSPTIADIVLLTPVPVETQNFPPVGTPTPAPFANDPQLVVASDFMNAVQRKDFISAFQQLDSETGIILTTPENLRDILAGLLVSDIQNYTFTGRQDLGPTAFIIGQITRLDNTIGTFRLELRLSGPQWRVKWFYNTAQ